MKDIIFFCYPRCSTCQKAKKWLEENSIKFTERDIVKDKPTEKELKEFFKKSGKLKDKLPEMTEDEMIKLLATDGKLVKRPMIVTKDFVLNGFKEEEWKEKLKK